jgi:hypothetical protein
MFMTAYLSMVLFIGAISSVITFMFMGTAVISMIAFLLILAVIAAIVFSIATTLMKIVCLGAICGIIANHIINFIPALSVFSLGGMIGAISSLLYTTAKVCLFTEQRFFIKTIVEIGVAFGVGAYLTSLGLTLPPIIGALTLVATLTTGSLLDLLIKFLSSEKKQDNKSRDLFDDSESLPSFNDNQIEIPLSNLNSNCQATIFKTFTQGDRIQRSFGN